MPLNKDGWPKTQLLDIPTPEGIVPCVIRMIDSSNIRFIGWPEKGGQPLMFIEFKGGARYVYVGVSRQRAVRCAYSESSGVYLNAKIKPNFKCIRLR
jgi:hypothetical protein